ncbi:MAG: hypothetical protein J2P36_34240 [Ktedonobacteraceae bacterium]|nr:hypothetical protein [Ktedonobacteraceae bacterium]
MMVNHLNLRNTLCELDSQGNLTLFRDGKSVRLLRAEVKQMLAWLSQKQKAPTFSLGETQFHIDDRQGVHVKTSAGELSIAAREGEQIQRWLQSHG